MEPFINFVNFCCSPGMMLYTILLMLSLVYWLISIFSGMDSDLDTSTDLDVDGHLHTEGADGHFHNTIFEFMGIGKIPLSIIVTSVAIPLWVMAYWANVLFLHKLGQILPWSDFALSLLLLIPALPISAAISRLISAPLNKLYASNDASPVKERIINMLCVITTSTVSTKAGQAEIVVDGDTLILSVKLSPNSTESLTKNDKAVIIDYDEESHTYTVSALPENFKKDLASDAQAHHYNFPQKPTLE